LKPAILIVDHGSRRPDANALVDRLAERVRCRLPDRVVQVAHMELAEPTVAQGLAACAAAGASEVIVHPYFLGPGRHTTRSIPQLVEEAARAHTGLRIRITEPLGLHESLVDVVLARVDEASR
jgi:sirohydrochlorin ferrochelatase